MRVLCEGGDAVTVPDVVYRYVVNATSITKSRQTPKKQQDKYLAHKAFAGYMAAHGLHLDARFRHHPPHVRPLGHHVAENQGVRRPADLPAVRPDPGLAPPRRRQMSTTMEIDLVYLWVDGNDPAWLAKKKTLICLPTSGWTPRRRGSAVSSRTTNCAYSLRSAERYAPWIRRIYILTDDQTPAGARHVESACAGGFPHREVMPSEILPVFTQRD